MKPIPVVFHLGPLQVHTYGIGLAVTFLFALWYFDRRLRAHGYPNAWLNRAFLWIVAAAIVGARVVHVVANIGFYVHNPGQIVAVWHGGLSSFGGLLFGVPTGMWLAHRNLPQLRMLEALDLVAPVLVAAWALGRLLGPQLMVAGGGHPTTSFIGLHYAGQTGKRLPVPLFQAAENFAIYLISLRAERAVVKAGGPTGAVLAVTTALWGLSRFTDEYFWLSYPGHAGALAVEGAGLGLFVGGSVALGVLYARRRKPTAPEEAQAAPAPEGELPAPA